MDTYKYINLIKNILLGNGLFSNKLERIKEDLFYQGNLFQFSFVSILFSVFAILFTISSLIISIGLTKSIIKLTRIICFFNWVYFISPIDKLSKKQREEKNNRKVEVVNQLKRIQKHTKINAYETLTILTTNI